LEKKGDKYMAETIDKTIGKGGENTQTRIGKLTDFYGNELTTTIILISLPDLTANEFLEHISKKSAIFVQDYPEIQQSAGYKKSQIELALDLLKGTASCRLAKLQANRLKNELEDMLERR
jgi:hypothetical protein